VIELDARTAGAYLHGRGVVPAAADVTVEELGWGISNVVLKASWPGGCIVVKQSLPKLRVEADWPFDRDRIVGERDCMKYLGGLLSPGSVPEVVFSDDASFAFGMTCVPAGGVLWKQALLDGEIDAEAARHAGRLLACVHRDSAGDERARERFASQTVLIQGRIDPYHLMAAEAHPDLAPQIHAEVERLLATRRSLVLGDYSPKNLFVYPGRVVAIDFEVAHWGDPAFDVAFLLTHLVLKASFRPADAAGYLGAAGAFWGAYATGVGADAVRTEPGTVRELGCLLLARIDGKSKVEYISDEETKTLVRDLARGVILSDETRLEPTLAAIGETLATRNNVEGRCPS
jgi:Phosphotransferase enzyme family